jgi:hypothetical protein
MHTPESEAVVTDAIAQAFDLASLAGTTGVPAEHPFLTKGVVLPTKPIGELTGALRRAVILREQGCCFTSTSGYGKSYGLKLAESQLRMMFPDAPIYRHIIDNQQVPSIRAFFKHFLLTVGEVNIKGETYDLRVRLEHRLIDKGLGTRMKLVILLIDEAQEMALQDFQFLKDVGNHLDDAGVQLVVIMMGQDPDFSTAVDKLRAAGRLDLVSRFALRRLKFRGLSTEDDFEALLKQLDTLIYPPGSRCTWTQAFVPNAWERGFRLAGETESLMRALQAALPNHSFKLGVSARQLFLAIRRYLLDYGDRDRVNAVLPSNLWETAVKYALIEDAAEISALEKRRVHGRIQL